MVEIIFLVVAVIFLFVLFRPRPYPTGPMVRILRLAGVVLLVVPGVISLVAFARPLLSEDPLGKGRRILVPAVPADTLEEGRAFLVRGFQVVEGNEAYPFDYFETVLGQGGRTTFSLEDGATLRVAVVRRDAPGPGVRGVRRVLDASWRTSGAHRQAGLVLLRADGEGLEESAPLYEAFMDDVKTDAAPLGSLLKGGDRPTRIHFFVTPLLSKDGARSESGSDWWNAHGTRVTERIRSGMERSQPVSSGSSGSSFSIGGDFTFSGIAVLFVGLLLFLTQCVHWVRVLMLFGLFCALYVGAMDSLVLRLHSAALEVGEPRSRIAAAVETAATRLHPVKAARSLLDVATRDDDVRVRVSALRCLSRDRMREALRSFGGMEEVRRLSVSGSDEIREAAGMVLQKDKPVAPTRPTRRRSTQR